MQAWKKKAIRWAARQRSKYACACGCGGRIKVSWIHFYRGIPKTIQGHFTRMKGKSKAQKWIEANQGKHRCQCGCNGIIPIKIHHHVRGIPKFLDFHAFRVIKPGKGKFGPLNGHYKGGRYVSKKGYVLVLVPGPGRSRYELEHRQIMERKVGRKLSTDETIHHENRKKGDNRDKNLTIIERAEHSRLHALAGETGGKMRRKRK